jgi:hypothetical protein
MIGVLEFDSRRGLAFMAWCSVKAQGQLFLEQRLSLKAESNDAGTEIKSNCMKGSECEKLTEVCQFCYAA